MEPRIAGRHRRKVRLPGDNLDGLVVNTELTLISIIQGTALYWLINTAYPLLGEFRLEYLSYIISGLIIILVFWSRALIHTFTLIRWPIEFGHNFFYVLCTFIQSVMYTQLSHPLSWNAWGALFWAFAGFLFWFDRGMIHARMKEESGPASQKLLAILDREQKINIVYVFPAAAIFFAASAAAAGRWHEFMIEDKGHQILGYLQLAGLLAYLVYILRYFYSITPLILESREEE